MTFFDLEGVLLEVNMNSTEIIFKLPQFEIKNLSDHDWIRVSEKDFLLKLVDNFEPLTPVLSELIQGKEIISNLFSYRIKL